VKAVFDRYFEVSDLEKVALAFSEGLTVETGEAVGAQEYREVAVKVPSLSDKTRGIAGESEPGRAAAIEFILEGLHLHKLLNKYSVDGRSSYTG
jgi:magnesium chelatase subunit I